MSKTILIGLFAATCLACAPAAMADEVTKTTTTTTKRTDPPVIVAPAPPSTTVVTDDPGCSTKKVVKTDGDTGDTVKKTTTDCD